MPNGQDKNWRRLLAAVNGFRSRYGTWPTRVRLFASTVEEFQEHLFSPDMYARLTEQIELVPGRVAMTAEDDAGRAYDYAASGAPDAPPDIAADEWLRAAPDKDYD